MSTSLLTFTPPGTVTPGEYLVCSHQHYHKTTANERWHRELDDEEMYLDSYDNESESESDSDASSRASRSPSPFSSSGSYHTAMSTPPPECDSRSASVASVSGRTTAASGHKKAYRRVFAAELKATSQVSVARKRKRAEKAASAVAAVRSIVCQWGGCGERMANGTQLWSHIERVHRPLGGGGAAKGAERGQKEEEEDMSVDEASSHYHAYDDDCDELDDSSDEEWAESSRSGAVTKSKPHMGMDRYQIRIRCQWKRCTTTIQFAGLRRHIESKHSGLRNTSCPKGCGYITNRPDMMPRHRNKCHYRGPRKEVVVDE